jgi:medium-chain acyl-[acyl-carrier-protein] hydrolase
LTGKDPITSMEELAQLMKSALHPHTNSTYAIFGHSMGALLGYEIAVRLEKSGARPVCTLFASGSRAPFAPSRLPPVSHLSDEKFLDYLRRLQGTPEELLEQQELMALLLPVIRADFAVAERYRPENSYPLQSSITIFSGDADEHASAKEMMEWRQLTRATFWSHRFPGDHFFLNEQPESVVRTIAAELAPYCSAHAATCDRTS